MTFTRSTIVLHPTLSISLRRLSFFGVNEDFAIKLASCLATLVKSRPCVKSFSSEGELHSNFYSFYCCTQFTTLSSVSDDSFFGMNVRKTFRPNFLVV